jgi:hypothetical protein
MPQILGSLEELGQIFKLQDRSGGLASNDSATKKSSISIVKRYIQIQLDQLPKEISAGV